MRRWKAVVMTEWVRGLVLVVAGLTAAACGSSSSGSPAPPTSPSPPPGPPSTYTVNARIVGTVTGEPVTGATVVVGGQTLTTDAAGRVAISSTSADTRDIVISGNGLLTRSSHVLVADRNVTIDVIQLKAPFNLPFFQQIARNAFETEGALEPLRPLSVAPRIHIRTVDERGQPIDGQTVSLVENALRGAAAGWSGGRFPLEVVTRGAETRQGQLGWVTVLWANPGEDDICGRATIGTTTGFIELHYRNESCGCGSNVVAPATVRHELGHVYGYWHSNSSSDVMYGKAKVCDQRQSSRELAHARYMYSRRAGNLDPDTDPAGTVLRARPVIVIDN